MAEKKKSTTEKKKKSYVNNIRIAGYLKDNSLEEIENSSGEKAIRGALVIATDKFSSYKVQFYVSQYNKDGDESADYSRMSALLPENTCTVASFLKNNPGATNEDAFAAATPVWVMGRLEEYATRKGEREDSMILFKGNRGGVASTDKGPFTPAATFEADIFINSMEPEVDEDNTETGRLLVEGLLVKYDGSCDKIDFIAVEEDDVAKFIKSNWRVGDTVNISGDLVSLQERILIESSAEERFGRSSGPQYETHFIRERRITGGSKSPRRTEEDGAISTDTVKAGLVKREERMQRNGERSSQRSKETSQESNFGKTAKAEKSSGSEDFEF